MPSRKTRQPAEATRYLLSADRRFRRLSLRKISPHVTTAPRRSKRRSMTKAVKASKPGLRVSYRPALSKVRPIILILVVGVSLATLAGASWLGSLVDTSFADAQPNGVAL